MQEFVQVMRGIIQKSTKSTFDVNYEKIRKQGAKAFIGTTKPMVVE